jgi:hypothetical protein
MVKQELQAEAVRLLVLLRAMYASRAQHHRVATTARCTRCDGSLPSPLHLAIKRNGFQMMFPPAATWTRAVGLRGLKALFRILSSPSTILFKRQLIVLAISSVIISLLTLRQVTGILPIISLRSTRAS